MMIRFALVGVGAIACSSCYSAAPAVASSPSNNANVAVQTLFTHDGCTVYRFFDVGYHYYARCEAGHSAVETMSTVSCGRNCARQDELVTETVSTRSPSAR